MPHQYTIIITLAQEGGYIADVPTLPGCITQGETEAEVTAMAQEAIEGYLETLLELGKPIPVEQNAPHLKTFKFNVDESSASLA